MAVTKTTGRVEVKRVVCAQDHGVTVNPEVAASGCGEPPIVNMGAVLALPQF